MHESHLSGGDQKQVLTQSEVQRQIWDACK